MAGLRSRLPPVNSLLAFEAAGRHLSFTRAALELGVTQAAVSRKIQIIEDQLGRPVFERRPRGLRFTAGGRRLHRSVRMSMEQIAGTIVDLRHAESGCELTVSTSVTFANYWLMARIAQFRAANPEIELKLVASAPVADLHAHGIDLAIRYGSGQWRGVEAVRLMDNDVLPVCAPAYLAGRPPPREPADLLDEVLLHLVEYDRNWVTWESWLRAFGVELHPHRRGLSFDNYLVLIQAALGGQGIALCGGRLAEDFIRRGALIRALDARLRSDRAFYLLQPAGTALSEPASLFRAWILREAGGAAG
jgi:LysR family glycine cleavage system transcriptional activator